MTYSEKVEAFAKTGASLIRKDIAERYRGMVPPGTRMLEPGFVPPDAEASVLIVSYFPNESDLDAPGTNEYERLRSNFMRWGETGTVDSYRHAYADWLASLDRIPFHNARTKPILDRAGLRNDQFAWLPFVKVPMKAGSSPGEDLIGIDRDATWDQIFLLKPKIVWIQGVAIFDTISGLVKERITDRILPAQSLSQYQTASKKEVEVEKISRRLLEYLDQV